MAFLSKTEMRRVLAFTRDYVQTVNQIKKISNKMNYLGVHITPAKAAQFISRKGHLRRELAKINQKQRNFGQILIRKHRLPVRGNGNLRNALRGLETVYKRVSSAKPLYKTPLPNNIVHKIVRTAYPV